MRVADSLLGRLMPLTWSAAVAIWVLAAALAMWAWIIRPRLLGRPKHLPLPPVVAARTAALAMAASRTGAAIGGLYLGFCVALIAELSNAAGREYAGIAATAAVGSAALAAAGLWLERMCRIPPDDGGEESPAGDQAWQPELGTERVPCQPRSVPFANGQAADMHG